MACLILRKQIETTDNETKNIVIPSIKMKEIRKKNGKPFLIKKKLQALVVCSIEEQPHKQSSTTITVTQPVSNLVNGDVRTSPHSLVIDTTSSTINRQYQLSISTLSQPCIVCSKEERRLARITCGHLSVLISCDQSLRPCPVCHPEIGVLVQIYI